LAFPPGIPCIYKTHLKLNFRMTTKLFLKHPESKQPKPEMDRQVVCMHRLLVI